MLILAICAGAIGACAQQPARRPFGDPAVWQVPPSRTYHVKNYKIVLRVDEAHRAIAGDETVTLTPFAPGWRDFDLDSAGLQIEHVALLQANGAVPLAFHLQDGRLSIALDRAYSPGETLAVRIAYHGSPQTGLTFIAPDAQDPSRPFEVWSYGWPENNHFWFPCWDYPNDKATSETIVTVPADQSVVSNGALVKVTRHGGEATYDWVERVPHSTYLTSIAVARWNRYTQSYAGKPVAYYVPATVDRATALRSFGLTPDMIAFYARLYGVDYPYAGYAQTAAHDFGGGLENIGATTLTDETLHDARAEADYPSTGLVAHELAHQWFGDLVTERGWQDAWLSEGFATFSAALYTGHHQGADAYRYEIWQDQNSARTEDETRYRRPIVDRHYLLPWQILDRTTYQKGAVVLDMLRDVLDDGSEPPAASPQEPLFRALQAYLEKFRGRNVDTHDLMETLRDVSGRNLDEFFHQWVFRGGYPEYQVRARYDPARRLEIVRVRQTQAVDAVTPLFAMPIELSFHGARGQHQTERVRVARGEQEFDLPLAFAPQWVAFDPHDYVFKTVDFPQPVPALAAEAAEAPAMMARLAATEQLGRSAGADPQRVTAALGQVLNGDPFYGVRVAAAEALGRLGGRDAKALLLAGLRQPDSRVRAAAALALEQFGDDPDAVAALTQTLHSDASYAAQAAAARALGRSGAPAAFAALSAAAAAKPDIHVLAGIFAGLAATGDPRATAIFQAATAPGTPDAMRQAAERYLRRGAGAPPGTLANAPPPPHLQVSPERQMRMQIRALNRRIQALQDRLAVNPRP